MAGDETKLDIMTCADADFFPVVQVFERNVLKIQGRYPTIYDLGMTEEQRQSLRSPVVAIDVASDFKALGSHGFIRTSHKPAAIRHALGESAGAVLYMDADMLLTERLRGDEFLGADLAVTPRHPTEIARGSAAENGAINAGLLYFSGSQASREILARWAALCDSNEQSDQRNMSDLLQGWDMVASDRAERRDGLALARLDPLIYNDTRCRTGKVLHFKNLGRRSKKRAARVRRWKTMALLIAVVPGAVRWLMHRRRARALSG